MKKIKHLTPSDWDQMHFEISNLEFIASISLDRLRAKMDLVEELLQSSKEVNARHT